MPTIDENLTFWDQRYEWSSEGDEWSAPWGGPEAQWHGTVLPRIHSFLPADTILEIAPGRGRWTEYLKDQCRRLILVDLSPACIEACKSRFSASTHIKYHVNDGASLGMIEDESVDFVFSFDSLVHAEPDIIENYVVEIARKLKAGGAGFIHHSNLGYYQRKIRRELRIRSLLNHRFVHRLEPILNTKLHRLHWRSRNMSAALFRASCAKAGLTCISQEIINWHRTRHLIDCLSTFAKAVPQNAKDCVVFENRKFMKEAARVAKTAKLNVAGRGQAT